MGLFSLGAARNPRSVFKAPSRTCRLLQAAASAGGETPAGPVFLLLPFILCSLLQSVGLAVVTRHYPASIGVGKSREMRNFLKLLPFYLIFTNHPRGLSSWAVSRADTQGEGESRRSGSETVLGPMPAHSFPPWSAPRPPWHRNHQPIADISGTENYIVICHSGKQLRIVW